MAKYVLYFSPEYFAGSLWSHNKAADEAFGYEIDYADLPLSKALVKLLRQFDNECVGIIDWSDPGKGDIRPENEAEEYYLTACACSKWCVQSWGMSMKSLTGWNGSGRRMMRTRSIPTEQEMQYGYFSKNP